MVSVVEVNTRAEQRRLAVVLCRTLTERLLAAGVLAWVLPMARDDGRPLAWS